tara:strand:+ start:4607 stop:4909 length:303 start_codon:yes stop_codon:yes gene_type:complete
MMEAVREFAETYGLSNSIPDRILDLASEVGELSKEYTKSTGHGKREFSVNSDWHMEMGDVLFVFLCLAHQTDVDVAEALQMSMDKLKKRFEKTGKLGSGR